MKEMIFLIVVFILLMPMVLGFGCGDGVCDIGDPGECIADCSEEEYDSGLDLPFGQGVLGEETIVEAVATETSEEDAFFSSLLFKVIVGVLIVMIIVVVGFIFYRKMRGSGNVAEVGGNVAEVAGNSGGAIGESSS
jgi:hypothetical protein